MSSTDADRVGQLIRPGKDVSAQYLSTQQRLTRFLEQPLFPMVGMVMLFVASFLNLVDVKVDKEVVAIDGQVLLKLAGLAVCGIYGLIGFLTDSKVRRVVLTFPAMWLMIIGALFVVSVAGSITKEVSMASALSVFCVVLMTVTALVQNGVKSVLSTIFHAMTWFVIFSWVVYFVWPEIGVLREALPDGEFAMRMSGLAHSNTLGQFSGLTVVLGVVLCMDEKKVTKWRAMVIMLAVGALVFSLSRTSLMATVVGLMMVYRTRIFNRRNTIYLLWLSVLGVMGLIFLSIVTDIGPLIESKLSFLTKSGNTDELTSATGRLDIWAYAIRKIGESPMIGYGASTSKYYFADYSSYTHNLVLNVAFSTGVLGGLAALAMCCGRLSEAFRNHHPIANPIVLFIVVNGLFENVIFSPLAGLPTILWTVGLCLPTMKRLGFCHDPQNQNSLATTGAIAGGER